MSIFVGKPPDRLTRLEQLRLLMRQGVDPTRAMVVELLDEVERRAPLVGDEITWREEARSLQLHFDDCLAENERLSAARDALADEVAEWRGGVSALGRKCTSLEEARDYNAELVLERDAKLGELRQQLNDAYARGLHEGETDEREACARVAETTEVLNGLPHFDLETWSRADIARAAVRATVKDIAAAIRARGEKPYGAVALSQPAASAAQERPQEGDAGKAPPAPQFAARFVGLWHHCRTGARQWPAGRAEPCPECGAAWGTSWLATASNGNAGK